jgi:hypothetical protein
MTDDELNRAADVFNALLRYEVGEETYTRLCAADPALYGPHDECDANILVLCAVAHVKSCTEDAACDIATSDHPKGGMLSDWLQEIAETRRNVFDLPRHA